MDLTSNQPFWAVRDGLICSYPSLTTSQLAAVDVVIIGAGITGALIAHRLVEAGQSVILLDRRDVGCGSSSASTGLLQYEIDTPLSELAKISGETAAATAYQACLRGIDLVEAISQQVSGGYFVRRPSFYFASKEADVDALQAEYALRRKHGLPSEYWDAAKISAAFDFKAPAGLMSSAGGEVDPYHLTHALLRDVQRAGGQIFDKTAVQDVFYKNDRALVTMENGAVVTAQHVVIAAGYESERFLPAPVAKLHSSFALVSEPLQEFTGWYERCLLWETARPYVYARSTNDDRLLIGGGDVPFRNAAARDKLLPAKTEALFHRAQTLFPHLPLKVDFSWAGTFAETDDGLPFIGAHQARPGLLFALCYGGNGIIYSVLAAEILLAAVRGEEHPLAAIFGFERQSSR